MLRPRLEKNKITHIHVPIQNEIKIFQKRMRKNINEIGLTKELEQFFKRANAH